MLSNTPRHPRTPALLLALACLVPACASKPTTPPSDQPIACSTEAKICPDGSGVGRTGPNCEFAACPDAAAGAGDPPAAPEAATPPAP